MAKGKCDDGQVAIAASTSSWGSRGRKSVVDVKGLRVLVGRVKCIPKVHEERIALPSKAILDERVRVSGSVKKVRCSDANGARAP
jgi:hypothetical protein